MRRITHDNARFHREEFLEQELWDLYRAGKTSFSFDGETTTFGGSAAIDLIQRHRAAQTPRPRRPMPGMADKDFD